MCGDVNGDGEIDIVDVVLLNRFINSGSTVEEFYKQNIATKSTLSFEQFLANIDTYRPSEKREITIEDSQAISGHINGLYPNLPIDEL
ncbi:hypothetical protein SAMN02910265_02470 [Ruminococcus flavefaciens]|uniref:Dockerin domain-containing protein n=1 Tax=Ruminococcus flavefaciens TaxID=1265 RepID=A0A1H6KMA6_RUMFL|nr:dockerin type I domain-containing protein [Ruminococcus flavefaciens]SEH74873.1 hypothetical protein SAMN02910265_02470 [Ruminococcus flavefaciens]